MEDERRRVEEIYRARLVLDELPSVMFAASQAGNTDADVYDIRLAADVQGMPGVHETAAAGIRPSHENLRGTAFIVYRACETLKLNPRIHFYFNPRGDKGGYMIRVDVPTLHDP